MRGIYSQIVAVICSSLLIISVPSFAQTNQETTSGFPNAPALSSYKKLVTQWLHESGLPESSPQGNAQEQARAQLLGGTPTASHMNLRAILDQDMAFPLDGAESDAQRQAKPSSSNEPSLKGLGFPPSEIQGSAKEQALLNKRSHMLQIHQKLGLLTTIPMIAALVTAPGAKGHHGLPGSPTGRDVHMSLGILTTGMYFATAYFAIRAPKVSGTQSYGLIRLHKAMAWIHGPGMIITPILGAMAYSQLNSGERIHGIAKYHSWAAYTTAVAYGVALLSVIIK